VTQLVKMRAEILRREHNAIDNIALDLSSQGRSDCVLALQNYTGAIADVMDFENLLSEDITNDTTEL
jgi:hypothetical protein